MSDATMQAVSTAANAIRQTQPIQAAEKALNDTGNKYLKKARNISLLGTSPQMAPPGAAGGGNSNLAPTSSIMNPTLTIQDGNKLNLQAGKFSASASRGGLKANFDLGRGLGIQGAEQGSRKSIGLVFRREF